jgi:hypothetical protein
MATAAEQEAAAARRAAAAHLDHAASWASPAPGGGRAAGGVGVGGRDGVGGQGGQPAGGGPPGRGDHRHPGAEHDGGPVRQVVRRVLEVGAEVVAATHHVAAAAEARVEAAGRLAATADDPAVRAAAARVVQGAGRPLVDGSALAFLPLAAPVLAFGAAMSSGEPLPRALAGAVGSAVGADLGSRAGMAACGGEAAATQGAGLILCPTLSAVGGALGAQAGKAAALHVYDEIAGPPVRPEPEPPPGPRPEPGG